jgi:hypothetical protein
MQSYYKGECMLDALSVAYFCANGAVFNWCSYLLEELLVACEEAQEKGDTFTYGYLLVAFTMLKWMPPSGRLLSPADKGRLEKMFEPWHSRSDSENTTFNNATFSKWYNRLLDATQRLCIPQEFLNLNTWNIAFNMNHHHTFVWPRHAKREDFHSRMLSFYLDEEAFDKEVMSWPGVKCNPCKSGMHYLLPVEILKKKGQEAGVGPSSGPEEKKKEAPMHTDSEEEDEEMQPLECKKRTFPMFPQLPEKAMLTGKDVNDILNVSFIGDPLVKKPRTGLSPVKILNPQPISSTIPRTRAMTRVAQMIIDIQDDPEPDTTPSTTIITEQPPSPPQPQSPPREITIPPQTTEPEPMQLDPPELPEHRPELTGPNPEVLSQQIIPFVPIQDTPAFNGDSNCTNTASPKSSMHSLNNQC